MGLGAYIKHLILTIEYVAYIVDAMLIVCTILLIKAGWKFRPRFDDVLSNARKKKTIKTDQYNISEEWESIKERALASIPKSYLMGIIEADALLGTLLLKMGIPGETVMDRLHAISKSPIVSLNNLFEAHRTRNIIAHAPGTTFPERELEQTFFAYETFFREIKVIK